ncbi:hypothetical protein NWE55_13695 [Myroides albus]|uniref:hypothetical protein n=1 Tax=Myroides albus TaxID=2562892 RepID=UPI00215966F0|nr:hypothetical protein [Myroides albus]UVD79166.1 hypothetical protein NWE55_13695 [Myroides albus]
MSIRHQMLNKDSIDGYFEQHKVVYSSFFSSEEGSFKITPAGALKLISSNGNFTISDKTIRGGKVNIFTSYVNGFYEVRADDTVDIKVTVTISGPNDQKGYVLGYLYQDKFLEIEKRELLINPNLNNYLYKDYSLLEPVIVPQDQHVLKSFKLEGLKIGNETELFIYVTLPILTGIGNSYVSTIHEIAIKKR